MLFPLSACCSVVQPAKVPPLRRDSRSRSGLDVADSEDGAVRGGRATLPDRSPSHAAAGDSKERERTNIRRERRRTCSLSSPVPSPSKGSTSKAPESTPEEPTPKARAGGVQELLKTARDVDSIVEGVDCAACLLGTTLPARRRGGAAVEADFSEKVAEAALGAEAAGVRARLEAEGVAIACRKGRKPEQPNQDSYFYCETGRFIVACVADGHGQCGHWVSHWASRCALRLLLEELAGGEALPEAEAFAGVYNSVHEAICRQAELEGFDVTLSGTTLTVVVADRTASQAVVAWCADSRCVIGRPAAPRGGSEVAAATADHKPEAPEERRRIVGAGGDVRRVYQDTPWRVFVRGREAPGLAMSRAIGDLLAHSVGVVHAPGFLRCSALEPGCGSVVLLCSDGVWEFITTEEALKMVMPYGRQGAAKAADALVSEARQRWLREDGSLTDDITALVIWI